jgi:hypothetical protein
MIESLIFNEAINIQENQIIVYEYDAKFNTDKVYFSANLYYDFSIVSTIVFQYSTVQFTIWDYFDEFTVSKGPIIYFMGSVYNPLYYMPSYSTRNMTVNIPPEHCVLTIGPSQG